jgi:hypothetical protein
MHKLRLLLRLIAILAALVWLVYYWRASMAPESPEAEQFRTAAFVLAFVAGSFGWPTRPRKTGSRDKERL